MANLDHAAAVAIAGRLREGGDPDVIALEIMTLIRGLGYRPTEARPAPTWRRPPGSCGTGPTSEYQRARARLEERLAERTSDG